MDERTTLRYIDELQGQIDKLKKMINGGVGSSVDYNTEVTNLPKVNGITLKGNKKSSDLKIVYSMTEAEYAAATKNAESIYCLQQNAAEVTETDSVSITWEQSGDDYVATLSYTPSDQDVTNVIDVTCDSDTVTIESFSLVHGDVVATLSTTDPAEVPESVDFTFILSQPIGKTRIVKDGVVFGGEYYSTYEQVAGHWIDGRTLYQKTYTVTLSNTANVSVDINISSLHCDEVVGLEAFVNADSFSVYLGHASFDVYVDNNNKKIKAAPTQSSTLSKPCTITIKYVK